MIAHYLKIGLRNICRNKQQSVVSIAGLAIGFVCFALSLLWVRYEMTYNRIPNSDRIYLCLSHDKYPEFLGGTNHINLFYGTSWLTKLKEENPEIEACVGILKTDYEEEPGIEKKSYRLLPGFPIFLEYNSLKAMKRCFSAIL